MMSGFWVEALAYVLAVGIARLLLAGFQRLMEILRREG